MTTPIISNYFIFVKNGKTINEENENLYHRTFKDNR